GPGVRRVKRAGPAPAPGGGVVRPPGARVIPPDAQHAWEDTFAADERGRPLAPRFHRLLMLELRGQPTGADAAHLEAALQALERRFDRGPGGVLTCLGWGRRWFTRHTALGGAG